MIVILLSVVFFLSSSGCNNAVNCNRSANNVTSTITQLDSTYSLKYRQAYAQGMQEALKEIKNDSMTFYEYGEEPDYPYNIETGLPAKIVAGCIINDSITGLVKGHNQTVKNHLQSLINDKEISKATSHLDSMYSAEYRKAYYQGMQEAYTEIKNNKLTRYVYGRGNWGEIDKETGLTYKAIAGCIVSDSIVGRADGHNYIIRKYLIHEIR